MSNFIETELQNIAQFYNGKSTKVSEHGLYDVYGANGVIGKSDEAKYENSIIIGRVGAYCGAVTYCENKFNASDNTIIATNKGDCKNIKFLYYLLKFINLNKYAGGAAQPLLTQSVLNTVKVPFNDNKDVQDKIAKILSNYDDLIENNNKRIKILEEMAQKIYKEWFVDFKYPGHETATFKDTELGRIPSDWEVKTLKDTIDSIKETIKPGEHLKNLRYVPIDCIPRKSFFLTTSESYKNAQSSLILFKKSDILFGNMRSYFHKVILAPFDGITRTTCFVLRPKVDNYRSWAFLTMFQDSTVAYSSRNSKGATIPYSFWEDGLAEMKVIFPSTKIIKAFNDIINPMLENIQQGYFKQENLKQTRDLLLPRLISGEIDVENLEIK